MRGERGRGVENVSCYFLFRRELFKGKTSQAYELDSLEESGQLFMEATVLCKHFHAQRNCHTSDSQSAAAGNSRL